MSNEHIVAISELQSFLQGALQKAGVPPAHAVRITEVLVDCELRGYDDHGAYFLHELLGWYASGAMNPAPQLRIVRETETATLLDGDRGCGAIAATEAMRCCITKARAHGFACAGIRNSGHFIAAGPYAMLAAEAGMIGFAASNVTPLMAPTGGLTRTFGTNPLAYAVPAGRHFPVLFDMATSQTAGFKVRMAALEGREVAPGLIEDAQGRPTTNPYDYLNGGLILPVGGYKGYGLAMIVDVLCGVLTGAGFAWTAGVTHGKTGQFFWALDVEQFMPRAEFLARMDEQIEQVKASARKAGVAEIFVPGERGLWRKQQLLAQGTVPLSEVTWRVLEEDCSRLGIPMLQPLQAGG